MKNEPVALTQVEIMEAMTLGIPLYTHPVKEFNDGGEPVKNATYWKRQYNLMASQNDNLKSGLYHANEQIKYLESHPVKELHLSLQKDKETGELLAVTYTDDEHRIVEVLWQKSLVKELDEDFDAICLENKRLTSENEALKVANQALKIMNDGKNKIIEEYEHKYPDFFFMENDLMGKR